MKITPAHLVNKKLRCESFEEIQIRGENKNNNFLSSRGSKQTL